MVKENGMAFGAAPIGLGIDCGEMPNWPCVANYALQNKSQTAMMKYVVSLVTLVEFASICVIAPDLFGSFLIKERFFFHVTQLRIMCQE